MPVAARNFDTDVDSWCSESRRRRKGTSAITQMSTRIITIMVDVVPQKRGVRLESGNGSELVTRMRGYRVTISRQLWDVSQRSNEPGRSTPAAPSRRRQLPERPPVFSQRQSSPMVIERSEDLHMS